MGVDIHMYIIRGNKMVAENIFDGRNPDWFNNLQGKYSGNEYDTLPVSFGVPREIPSGLESAAISSIDNCYYGHAYMVVQEFCEWFEKARPDRDAGWVTIREKWLIENKGHDPEIYIKPELDRNDILENMCFIEYKHEYDCSAWLYTYLKNKMEQGTIKKDDVIFYYFDC